MKTNQTMKRWGLLSLLLATALVIAACGGGEEPTPTPIPAATEVPAPTEAPAEPTEEAAEEPAAEAAESPLAQPESPLLQPESPLTAAPTESGTWAKSEEEAIAVAETTTPPEPQPGAAAVSGVLYSYGIDEVVPGTQFYLTPADEVDGEPVPPAVFFGPRPEEGDIFSDSTMLGQIQLDNVPPGRYYILVWTVYNWIPVYESQEATVPLLVTVEEGDQLDLGITYLNWP